MYQQQPSVVKNVPEQQYMLQWLSTVNMYYSTDIIFNKIVLRLHLHFSEYITSFLLHLEIVTIQQQTDKPKHPETYFLGDSNCF